MLILNCLQNSWSWILKSCFLLLLALNDSNRFLRDERDQLKSKLELNEKLLKEYETKLTPLREQIVKFQEELDKEKAENLTLKTDGQRWRQRVNQLIEKHQKISPEELLKVKCRQIIHITAPSPLQAYLN